MRLAVLLLLLAILIAPSIVADGLQITEMDVHVDYDEAYTYRVENRDRIDSTTVSLTNGSKIEADVLPGSNVTFTIRVENTFSGEEPDLRGVFTRVTIEDIDDGSDLEQESLDFELEPGDDYRFDVEFNVPLDVDAGTYNAIVEAEGKDRNETDYETKLNLKLEVKKQSHDIRITKVSLSPSILSCDRKSKLTAEITNVGMNQENEVALEFKLVPLGINSYDKDITLLSSDEATDEERMHIKTLNIEVPSFFRAGNYPVLVNLYWKNFVLFDQKTLELVVNDCGGTPKQEQNESETQNQTQETPEQFFMPTKESSNFVLVPIILGGVIIAALVVILIIGYLKNH